MPHKKMTPQKHIHKTIVDAYRILNQNKSRTPDQEDQLKSAGSILHKPTSTQERHIQDALQNNKLMYVENGVKTELSLITKYVLANLEVKDSKYKNTSPLAYHTKRAESRSAKKPKRNAISKTSPHAKSRSDEQSSAQNDNSVESQDSHDSTGARLSSEIFAIVKTAAAVFCSLLTSLMFSAYSLIEQIITRSVITVFSLVAATVMFSAALLLSITPLQRQASDAKALSYDFLTIAKSAVFGDKDNEKLRESDLTTGQFGAPVPSEDITSRFTRRLFGTNDCSEYRYETPTNSPTRHTPK